MGMQFLYIATVIKHDLINNNNQEPAVESPMFIPIYDGKPLVNISRSWVNWGLIAANIFIFFAFQKTSSGEAISFSLGLIPAVVNDLAVLPEEAVWVPEDLTYITYAFLHGDTLHLLGNMLFLWVFGDNIEDAMGHVKYFIFYIVCAVIAGIAHSAFFSESNASLIGASGAVAGIVVAYLMLHPNMRVWVLAFGKIPLPISAMWCLGAWVAFQVFQLITNSESQVSWIAHVGGIAAGAVLLIFLKKPNVPLFDRTSQEDLTD